MQDAFDEDDDDYEDDDEDDWDVDGDFIKCNTALRTGNVQQVAFLCDLNSH